MRKYPTEARSLLGIWMRMATPAMREDLCKRVGCPENTIMSLAYGNRKMPRLDRAILIEKHCNAIRQEAIDSLPGHLADPDASAVIPPLMTLQALVDGANRGDR